METNTKNTRVKEQFYEVAKVNDDAKYIFERKHFDEKNSHILMNYIVSYSGNKNNVNPFKHFTERLKNHLCVNI